MTMNAAASPIVPVWRWLRNPAFWMPAADLFAMLTALALPWSTSLVAIFAACWIGAAALAFDWRAYPKFVMRPICALPCVFGLAVSEPCGRMRHGAASMPIPGAARVHPGAAVSFPALVAGMCSPLCLLHPADVAVVIVAFEPARSQADAQYGVP
jgi:hypothetical protein